MNINKIKTIYALYGDDEILLKAIKYLIKNNILINEVYTPFPIHELNELLNIKKSRLSEIGFIYSIFGCFFGCFLTWYMMIYDWPQNIGGKPNFSFLLNIPSFIPVIFELTIFFTAHLMVITYLYKNKIFPGAKAQNPDPRTTDDKFVIEINSVDIEKIKKILINSEVEEIIVK